MCAYRALRDDVSIGEAMELETVRCILGDRRAAFQDWYPDYMQREREASRTRGVAGEPSIDEMLAEIARRTDAVDKLTTLVAGHRCAVGCALSGRAEPPGRLPNESLDAIETAITSHREVLTYLEKQVTRGD